MTKPKSGKISKGLVFFLFLFSVVSSKSFAADKTSPSGSIKINNNSSYTSSSSVTLNLSATDKGSGMKKGKMRFSNDHSSWSNAESYKTTKSWSLSSGNGAKAVYAKFSDSSGNWMSQAVSDNIMVDTVKPSKPRVTDSGSSTSSTSSLYVSWSSSYSASGIAEYQYQLTQDSSAGTVIVSWTSAGTSASVTKTSLSLTSGKSYYFGVKAKNGAGLWSDIGYSDGITVKTGSGTDTTKPSKPSVSDSGSTTSSTSSLYASWSASDSDSGISEYQYQLTQDSSSGTVKVSWISAGTATSATKTGLSLTSGKSYYFGVKAKNGAGLWSDVGYSDGITVNTGSGTDTTPPVISSYSPNPNSFIYKGKTQALSLTTSDSGDSSNEYQFSVDGTVKQSWSSKTSYSWDTSGLDTKSYTLKFEAKDQGGSSSKTAKAFVLNEPVSPPDGY